MSDEDRGQLSDLRRRLGERLRTSRRQAGLSQEQLARRVGYSRSAVAAAEIGDQQRPEEFWVRCDELLVAGGAITGAYRELAAFQLRQAQARVRRAEAEREAKIQRWRELAGLDVGGAEPVGSALAEGPALGEDGAGLSTACAGAEAAVFDAPFDIARRTQRLAAANVDSAILAQLDQLVEAVISSHDHTHTPTASIARCLVPQRRWLDELLGGHQHPEQRERLYVVAATMSGVLAAAAMDLGRVEAARGYSVEAFQLATHTRQDNVIAWVRATQSLIEYYAGDYQRALAYARDGQSHARGGPQTVRLALNGEARALAQLNDAEGVHEAVGRGFDALNQARPDGQVAAILTLEAYCPARAAANAATAYLTLGHPSLAREYAAQALGPFDRAGSTGPQALTRLDLATAQLHHPGPDVEAAAALVGEALRVDDRRFEPLAQRSAGFLHAAARWGDQPAIRDIRDQVRARFPGRPQRRPIGAGPL
jgi:DNA-binding XRE family transcriptional regulator